ncbi:MAG: MBL fold metallo-hydrolase [Candidatus Hydrogenedentes bacterium]|nr:MBL fold metallo-hydrolase [Candidatus Hydrogenedentota bacterium]
MHPVIPIKAAAGMILTAEPTPRVLLARRSAALRFMAGFHVFPGGRIDDEEPTAPVVNALDTASARGVHAVAREIFEETGLLVGTRNANRLPAPSAKPETRFPGPDTTNAESETIQRETIRAARMAILDGKDTFDAFLTRHHLRIDATQFEFAGDWVTPAIAPIRFDTRYYIVRVPIATGEELHVGEIDALDWFTPAGARAAWRCGTIQLPPPVAYVLQNLAAYPFPDVLDHLRDCGEHTGDRPSKMEFANGIYMLPLRSPTLPPATHTNCIIIGERELYLIDPAANDDEERALLIRQIKLLEDLGGAVKAIILTHSHIDHVCAANFCRQHYNAPIWAHPETARQLGIDFGELGVENGVSGNAKQDPNTAFHRSPTANDSPTEMEFPKPDTRNPTPAPPVDRYLHDGDLITIPGAPPWQLRALHTPGHDPGHLCFIEETTRTLIAGDLIANPGTIVVSLDHGGDMTQFIDSLERVANQPGYDTILPAHGMPLTHGPDKIRKHLEHRLWREGKVKAAIEAGKTALAEILPLAYDDVPPETWPLAELSLKSHLKRLNCLPSE